MATVVFLPPLPLTSAVFDVQAAALQSEHVVVQLDYPGFADRPYVDGLDLTGYVRLTRDVIAALEEFLRSGAIR